MGLADKELVEADDEKEVWKTPFGLQTVFKKDQPGPRGGKAGTTNMVYDDPPPRTIKLKKKYRQQS